MRLSRTVRKATVENTPFKIEETNAPRLKTTVIPSMLRGATT